MPLTREEIEEQSKEWETQGYTVEFLSGHDGQSREIFPELAVEKVEASDILVSIPDRKGMSFLSSCITRVSNIRNIMSSEALFR